MNVVRHRGKIATLGMSVKSVRHWTRVWTVLLFLFCVSSAHAIDIISVNANENGHQQTGLDTLYFDREQRLSLDDITQALDEGEFSALKSAGSTGLIVGNTWSAFELRNTSNGPITLYLEYIDHQIIDIEAFQRTTGRTNFNRVAELSLTKPSSHRLVNHNRFVVPVDLAPNQRLQMLIRFGATEAGFTYPSMRIWSPEQLMAAHTKESALVMFLFGGFALMALFSIVAGFASGRKVFYLYALYSLSKITCWATILGFTHQHLLRDNFHWSLMSISGAITIVCGLIFARAFLRTREFTPKADYVLLFMVVNALTLMFAAIFQIKIVAIITITLALLLYPVLIVVGLIRWRQGATEAGVFTIAWTTLVVGLITQAMRDMGVVPHTLFNYYLPPVASYIEMLTIMFAMGMLVRHLRRDKEMAEGQYREHLEASKTQLEQEVRLRTNELQLAKARAEVQANTDELTGIHNRRSFMQQAEMRLKLAARQEQNCTLFMFDLDHFKRINDTFGHSAGDEVLRTFARAVEGMIRDTDIFGRLGGEEFVLLITEDCDNSSLLAERLLNSIRHIRVSTERGEVSLTASIGQVCGEPPAAIESLMHDADRAMYQAKAKGRNRVELAQ